MILDDYMDLVIDPVKVSYNGSLTNANIIKFKHPTPSMARDTFRMKRYFSGIQKEAIGVMANMEGGLDKVREQAPKLEAGEPVTSVHEDFSDDLSDEQKEAKLAEIEDMVEGFLQMLDLCENVDLYQMTCDFGKMICNNKRAELTNKDNPDMKVYITQSIWENEMQPNDRLIAAVRYCCFFGLISSLKK